MSAFLLDRDTYLDLCAWLQWGRVDARQWSGGDNPGMTLLTFMGRADADLLPEGTIGYHATATAEAIVLGRSHGKRPGLDTGPAAGQAVCRALYDANRMAVCCRYNDQPMDGWADLRAGLTTRDAAMARTWNPANALGLLACWGYQCSEDVPASKKAAHTALMCAVRSFRLELAEHALKVGKPPTNVHPSGGWAKGMASLERIMA